jgi:two-component system sensor histidine kinase MprB
LSRAVRNLIENAIAHTPEGKVVRLDLDDAGVIRVIDQGPGVAVEDRSRIFRRFWRGKGRKGPGAGLGLSIVQRFATTFGGSVEVGDAPGGGAEFILRLPLAEAPPAAGEGGGR